MERTGWLHILIAIFTAIGTLFTGGRGDPANAQAGAPAQRAPVVMIFVEPSSGKMEQRELDAAVKTLQARFPKAAVLADDVTGFSTPSITIQGDLEGDDATLEWLATTTGGFRLLITASEEDANELSVDLAEEKARVDAFLAADEARRVGDYNALSPEEGGSPERLVFGTQKQEGGTATVPLIVESNAKWRLDERAISRTFVSVDQSDRPALGFDVDPERQADFEAFTTEHEGQQLAILVGDRILTRPTLNAPLSTGGIITGGGHEFAYDEVSMLHRVLSAPKLESKLQVFIVSRTNGR